MAERAHEASGPALSEPAGIAAQQARSFPLSDEVGSLATRRQILLQERSKHYELAHTNEANVRFWPDGQRLNFRKIRKHSDPACHISATTAIGVLFIAVSGPRSEKF